MPILLRKWHANGTKKKKKERIQTLENGIPKGRGERSRGLYPVRSLINMSAIKLGTNSLLGVRQLIARCSALFSAQIAWGTKQIRMRSTAIITTYMHRITCTNRCFSFLPAYADRIEGFGSGWRRRGSVEMISLTKWLHMHEFDSDRLPDDWEKTGSCDRINSHI